MKFYDSRVKIPIVGEMGLYNLVMDEFWIADIYKMVRLDYKTCIDFGANLGQTLIKLKAVDPSCNYIGIEPNINCVYYLNELILQNKYQNTTIIPAAIGEKEELNMLYFLWDEKADRSATSFPDSNRVIHKQLVSSLTYDKLCAFFPDGPLFIKIDIEKAEHVLLKYVLGNQKNIILIEVLPGSKPEDLLRIKVCNESINTFQFEIYRILKHKEYLSGFQRIHEIPTEGKIEESDYMLVHGNQSHKFKHEIKL
ncbi:MAG: FkbM family methyltransferase [Saprospiraceae bacterium]|nr:FkbM family methyltransferase [Saprospiraceae bacterium]